MRHNLSPPGTLELEGDNNSNPRIVRYQDTRQKKPAQSLKGQEEVCDWEWWNQRELRVWWKAEKNEGKNNFGQGDTPLEVHAKVTGGQVQPED